MKYPHLRGKVKWSNCHRVVKFQRKEVTVIKNQHQHSSPVCLPFGPDTQPSTGFQETSTKTQKQRLPAGPRRKPTQMWMLLQTQIEKNGGLISQHQRWSLEVDITCFLMKSQGLHMPLGNQQVCKETRRIYSQGKSWNNTR